MMLMLIKRLGYHLALVFGVFLFWRSTRCDNPWLVASGALFGGLWAGWAASKLLK